MRAGLDLLSVSARGIFFGGFVPIAVLLLCGALGFGGGPEAERGGRRVEEALLD